MKGRWALVTGASSGLGAEFARQLAARGVHLVLVARREDRLRTLASSLEGVKTEVVTQDLGLPDAASALKGKTDALGIQVDILVNNAGFGVWGEFLGTEWSRVAALIDVDIKALTHLTHVYAKPMVERGWGRVLQVASIGGFQACPTYAVYCAAKAYVLLFSEALHQELKGTGVSCTALCPGYTETEFLAVSGQEKTAYQRMMAMEAPQVVRAGISAMERERSSVIPGLTNNLAVFGQRFLPRDAVTSMAGTTMAARR